MKRYFGDKEPVRVGQGALARSVAIVLSLFHLHVLIMTLSFRALPLEYLAL